MSEEAIEPATLVRDYVGELLNRNAGIFAGAGLSVASGYVDWKGLLKDLITDLKLNPDDESDLVRLAQYHCNQHGSKGRLIKTIFDQFTRMKDPAENHQILAQLPVETYWTTNYDKLIETALTRASRRPDVKYTVSQLANTKPDRDAVVYKMHGDVEHPEGAVISRDDYEKYPHGMGEFVAALRGDLVSKTFLFLGFSFTDPNLDYVLSRVRVLYNENQRTHYCIQKRVLKEHGETDDAFKYRQLKQHYFIKDLKRFAVQTALVDDYRDITALLTRILRSYQRHSIFVAGAAETFAPWTPEDAQTFFHDLGFRLASNRCRVVTGFGLGVGSSVINGVLDYLDSCREKVSDRHLVMRPFPQTETPGKPLSQRWTEYRISAIAEAGVAIFVFGNKRGAPDITLSNGMREEFELCKRAGVSPLPVGVTGYMAEELWKEVNASFGTYFPKASGSFRKNFEALNEKTTTRMHLPRILNELVDELKRGH